MEYFCHVLLALAHVVVAAAYFLLLLQGNTHTVGTPAAVEAAIHIKDGEQGKA